MSLYRPPVRSAPPEGRTGAARPNVSSTDGRAATTLTDDQVRQIIRAMRDTPRWRRRDTIRLWLSWRPAWAGRAARLLWPTDESDLWVWLFALMAAAVVVIAVAS